MAQSEIVVAIVSIIIYFLLACTSLHFYYRLRTNMPPEMSLVTSAKTQYVVSKQQFARESKYIFFIVLFFCALCDIPFYAGCLYEGGPHECTWSNTLHTVVWSLHLLSLFGYLLCLGIPLFLWSDVLNGRDGKLFNSAHQILITVLEISSVSSVFLSIALSVSLF